MADDTPVGAPVEEDLRADDQNFNPSLEPKKAKAWLNLLQESEDAFQSYNEHCDNIDKQYASLERLSNMLRDKEFQMFWANAEVIKPSIYASPPIPVVVPKFKDRRPVYDAASELLERCAIVAFDLANIDELMKLVRDDLALIDRGVAWCRYESAGDDDSSTYDYEKVCIDFKNRRDFLHSISRNWREVTWVAGASYLTRSEARARFQKHSGDEYQNAEYKVDKESKEVGGADNRERAKFWEIWSKADRRVVWVSEGCENILDEDDPHLDLREFFPCPKPAYGTVQRGSLVPVPDVLQYKDQLDEINLLTGRIHAISEAIEAKGFYPAGGSEIGDAVQAAIAVKTPGRVLVPISNWAAFGGSSEVIIWLPIDMLAQTITGLVQLRQQIVQDIYQIMGLSDIMRGSTDPQETLGAQQLKTDYGSVRISDKQDELARIARDLVEITCEIITEKFDKVTMIEMSQTQLPTNQMVAAKTAQIQAQLRIQQQQVQQVQLNPQAQQMAQQNPDQAGQIASQAQLQIQQGFDALYKLQDTPTIDQVFDLFKNNRVKSFVLDIETDSTIRPDETAEKQRRSEFIGMLSQLMPQLAQMITSEPKTAPFCGELLKFAVAPFRAGRSLDGAIDDLVEQMKQKGDQPRGDDPVTAQNKTALQIEQMKVQAQQQSDNAKLQLQARELQMKDQHKQAELANERAIALAKLQQAQSEDATDAQVQNQKLMESREAHQSQMIRNTQEMQLDQRKADLELAQHQLNANQATQRAAAAPQFNMAPRGRP
jgi:hypothetical protein